MFYCMFYFTCDRSLTAAAAAADGGGGDGDVVLMQAMKQRHEAFEGDLATHQERVEQIAAIAHELKSVTHAHAGRVARWLFKFTFTLFLLWW